MQKTNLLQYNYRYWGRRDTNSTTNSIISEIVLQVPEIGVPVYSYRCTKLDMYLKRLGKLNLGS